MAMNGLRRNEDAQSYTAGTQKPVNLALSKYQVRDEPATAAGYFTSKSVKL